MSLVAEPIGVERVGQEPVVAHEILDGSHAADVGLVISE
jgi:hypothetical protein